MKVKGESGVTKSVFDAYIAAHGKRLFGLCLRLCAHREDAEDLYQETWLKAYRVFDTYDPARAFEGWLTGICVNAYRDLLRRQKWKALFPAFATNTDKDLALHSVPAPEEADYSDVRAAVDALPDKLRTVVVLYYWNGVDVKKTAEALGIPEGTVKYRLSRARELLKGRLSEDG
jgi:RNA polymerase sigma-70 factor (ECF subfamily)